MSAARRHPDSIRIEALEDRRLLSASMVTDLNTSEYGSLPQSITDVNGTLFFTAPGLQGGALYKSDGTAAGTTLVKDVFPFRFTPSPSSRPLWLTNVNGTLYFTPADGPNTTEVWRSDGTPDGTYMLKDVAPGSDISLPQFLTAAGDTLYFLTSNYSSASFTRDLWRSDGTEAGTVRVKSFTTPYDPQGMVVLDGRLFLAFQSGGGAGSQMWTSDGTEAGTTLLLDTTAARYSARPFGLTPVPGSGLVFFAANDASNDRELWATDGTPAGTRRVKDIRPGAAGSNPERLTARADGTLVFTADDGAHGRELWTSDGTAAGTVMVSDLMPGTAGAFAPETFPPMATPPPPRALIEAGGAVYFAASDAAGPGLFRSDGTAAAGTTRLVSLPATDAVSQVVDAGRGRVLFASGTASYSDSLTPPPHALWQSDGTAAGTSVVRLFSANAIGTLVPFGPPAPDGARRVAFSAAAPDPTGARNMDNELWTSDGTAGGTAQVIDLVGRTASSYYAGYAGAATAAALPDGRVLFAAGARGYDAPNNDQDLWATDGSAAGTARVKDLIPGARTRIDTMRVAPGGRRVYMFAGDVNVNGARGLWRTDGTEAGTVEVRRLDYGPFPKADEMVFINSVLYFAADDPTAPRGRELWGSDGTAGGTWRVKDINTASLTASSNPVELTAAGGILYFTTADNALWRSDGTESGTVSLRPFPAAPFNLTDVGGRLYFMARWAVNDYALWRSDGTYAGTVPLKVIGPIDPAQPLVVAGNRLLFAADVDGIGREPWVSDGTPAGTVPLKDLVPGAGGSSPANFLTAGDGRTAYFTATDPAAGRELWRTDGTPAGTALVADVRPGPAGSGASPVGFANGLAFFVADDGTHGSELWFTDGTAAGTALVADVTPGPGATAIGRGVFPLAPDAAGRPRALFFADDAIHGLEPWVTPAPPAAVVGRHVFYNNSAFDGRDPMANALDDGAVAPDKQALVPGQAPSSFANVTSYARGINGLMIDVAGLPAGGGELSADDFIFRVGRNADASTWAATQAPSSVGVRRGAGAGGSDRVTIVWPDGAIRNTWLRVTLKATPHTGLSSDDVFYFGNLVGDAGAATPLRVDAIDYALVRAHLSQRAAAPDNRYDFDRDGRVTAADLLWSRANVARSLPALNAPATTSFAPTGERNGVSLAAGIF